MSGPVLLVGAGGIGAPAAWALAAAGIRDFRVADDDRVETTNLHRQILFEAEDVGRPKVEAFARVLAARFGAHVDPRPRVLPTTVQEAVAGAAVVVDATDNFASRFLLADACRLGGVPVVHAAAIRLRATVLAVGPEGRPCYRCLFEDLPDGPAPDCGTAGILGPVCGVAGALAADRALALLGGGAAARDATGAVLTYDGRTDRLRAVPVRARADCPLCGHDPALRTLDASRYNAGPACGAPAGALGERS